MTDCNHKRRSMGDIQCKLSEQLGQYCYRASIRLMGRVKTMSYAKLRARFPVPNTTPIVARIKVV